MGKGDLGSLVPHINGELDMNQTALKAELCVTCMLGYVITIDKHFFCRYLNCGAEDKCTMTCR
jgi:hypothetical protein